MKRLRQPWRLLAGVGITGVLCATAILSRICVPEPPTRLRLALRLKPPLVSGLFGTDAFGRDELSLLMAGAWTSLTIALGAVLLGAVAGIALGLAAAARPGWTAEGVLRFGDVLFAFPALLSGIVIATLVGPGAVTAVLAIGLFALPVFVRVTHAEARRVWAQEFCLAAAMMGKTRLGITLDHVLPNIAGALAVQVTVQLGLAILVEAGLSFLGLSVPPPAPSWGRMLFEAQTYLGQAPWMAIAPGAAIGLAVLGFNLVGDGLRDWLDPRLRNL